MKLRKQVRQHIVFNASISLLDAASNGASLLMPHASRLLSLSQRCMDHQNVVTPEIAKEIVDGLEALLNEEDPK